MPLKKKQEKKARMLVKILPDKNLKLLPCGPERFSAGSQIFKLLIKLFRKFSSEGI
jgi:hypothetical protein